MCFRLYVWPLRPLQIAYIYEKDTQTGHVLYM